MTMSNVFERIIYDQLHPASQPSFDECDWIFKAPFLLFCSPENVLRSEEISR